MKLSILIDELQALEARSGPDTHVYVSYPVGPDICDYDSTDAFEVSLDDRCDVKVTCLIS